MIEAEGRKLLLETMKKGPIALFIRKTSMAGTKEWYIVNEGASPKSVEDLLDSLKSADSVDFFQFSHFEKIHLGLDTFELLWDNDNESHEYQLGFEAEPEIYWVNYISDIMDFLKRHEDEAGVFIDLKYDLMFYDENKRYQFYVNDQIGSY